MAAGVRGGSGSGAWRGQCGDAEAATRYDQVHVQGAKAECVFADAGDGLGVVCKFRQPGGAECEWEGAGRGRKIAGAAYGPAGIPR